MKEKKVSQPMAHLDGVAWFACPKEALNLIRESLEHGGAVASGLAVYQALCEIANQKGERFQTTHAFISMRCGFGVRMVRYRVSDLAALKLIGVKTPQLRAPSTYTMLPIGTPCRTIGSGVIQASVPRSKERKKTVKNGQVLGLALPTEIELLEFAEDNDIDSNAAQAFYDQHELMDNWTTGGVNNPQPIRDWKKALVAFAEKYVSDREGILDI